jgi:hypothetical protein
MNFERASTGRSPVVIRLGSSLVSASVHLVGVTISPCVLSFNFCSDGRTFLQRGSPPPPPWRLPFGPFNYEN